MSVLLAVAFHSNLQAQSYWPPLMGKEWQISALGRELTSQHTTHSETHINSVPMADVSSPQIMEMLPPDGSTKLNLVVSGSWYDRLTRQTCTASVGVNHKLNG